MTTEPASPTPTQRATDPKTRWVMLALIGLAIVGALIVALFYILGGSKGRTISLDETPNLTGTPHFTKQTLTGYKTDAVPNGVKNTIRLIPTSGKCTVGLSTVYIPSSYKVEGDDSKLTKAYLGLVTGGIPNPAPTTEITVPTADGNKLTFLQTRYATKTKINNADTTVDTRFAFRAINTKISHGENNYNTNKVETVKTAPILAITYQCTGSTISTKTWNNLLTAQKIQL